MYVCMYVYSVVVESCDHVIVLLCYRGKMR